MSGPISSGMLFVPKNVPRPIQPTAFARNGTAPQALTWQQTTERLIHALRWRRKLLWRWHGRTSWLAKSGATRERWRFRARTGILAANLAFRVQIASTAGSTDPYVVIVATPVGGGTTITLEVHYGAGMGGTETDVTGESWIGLSRGACAANQEYTFTVTEHGDARLVSVCAFEESLPPSIENGYPTGRWSALSPIYDGSRQEQLETATDAWKWNAAGLFAWAVNRYTAPKTIASSASTVNVIDGSAMTGLTRASLGHWVDLEYCNTVGKSTVPCEFAVYSSGGGNGEAYVNDVSGATVASITGIGAEGWYTASCDLPPSEAKYFVSFGDTFTGVSQSLWSFALAQYEA